MVFNGLVWTKRLLFHNYDSVSQSALCRNIAATNENTNKTRNSNISTDENKSTITNVNANNTNMNENTNTS